METPVGHTWKDGLYIETDPGSLQDCTQWYTAEMAVLQK